MSETLQDKLIDVIRSTMKRHDITNADLCRKLNMNQGTLGKYLLKQRDMPAEVALSLAKELKIDLNRLCGIDIDNITDSDYEMLKAFKALVKLTKDN